MPTCGRKCVWSFPYYDSSCCCNTTTTTIRTVSCNIRPSSSSVTLSNSHPFWCRFKKQQQQLCYSSATASGLCCTYGLHYSKPRPLGRGALSGLPDDKERQNDNDDDDDDDDVSGGVSAVTEEIIPGGNTAIVSACITGLLTGITVVFFNIAVHGIREFCWGGIAYRGASWLREEPFEAIWARVILVPASGGLLVSLLSLLQSSLEGPWSGILTPSLTSALQPIFKTVAACVTLGTGNSLGPEGPSVQIGASVAKGVAFWFDKGAQIKLSLRAAGSAAGISSGFNAAVAGCFFAVESVLWPSPPESSLSLTNTTSMVILSAVIASVVSEIGLGSEPAFTIPEYDFRSPSELPLYLLLGILCGLVSVSLSRCTSFMLKSVTDVQKTLGLQKATFPVVGGLAVGLLALAYPEILYWGFENVDILLESRPFVKGLSVELLVQLVAIKILATSFCRASGLVGGYYAPSLFIGAATGMAYGKVVGLLISQSNPNFHLSIAEVASPQAYGLVGMAATLAGVCQVPLTAVLLLFELTQDYRIVLPLLGAVGMSSWITSGQAKRRDADDTKQLKDENAFKVSYSNQSLRPSMSPAKASKQRSLCELKSSLYLTDPDYASTDFTREIVVSQAMRTKYVTVLMSTLLTEVVSLMLVEKQSCAVIVDDDNLLIGVLTLDDIQLFSRSSLDKTRRLEVEEGLLALNLQYGVMSIPGLANARPFHSDLCQWNFLALILLLIWYFHGSSCTLLFVSYQVTSIQRQMFLLDFGSCTSSAFLLIISIGGDLG